MQGSNQDELLKAALHRKLTPEEQGRLSAHFAGHPEAQMAWEEEMSLNQLLQRLPNVPVASNFTSQVVRLAERERSRQLRLTDSTWWQPFASFKWIQRIALATVLLSVGGFSYYQHERLVRKEVAQSVATVSKTLPTLEMLENFEAIRRLNQVPQKVDVELLAALQ